MNEDSAVDSNPIPDHAYGLFLNMNDVTDSVQRMRGVNALRHVDVEILSGSKRVSMTLDEFIDKLGLRALHD